ncbi:MAG TPA: SRPBCC family protein [Gaiellaceae bacterium]|jgi:uncharacterized protein YndB with AHSA1/START domain|nr:SRPBCC family protein [Gaiellaceae bacterium]
MTNIQSTLGSAAGFGTVRLQGTLDAGIDDVWSALTEPARLAQWYGEIEGDLRAGGRYEARLHASGWEGAGHVEACEPPQRLRVVSRDPDEPNRHSTEVTLSRDGDRTTLVVEQHALPLDLVWAYGTGLQIHVEDLAAHLAGKGRVDAAARFGELEEAYKERASALTSASP